MIKSLLIVIIIFSILLSCQSEKKISDKQEYLDWVGDIEYDSQTDEPDFKVCNGDDKILQYFNSVEGPVYYGEKLKILNTFRAKYKSLPNKEQNGFIRIRFIVNCDGKAGRFRVLQSNYNYQKIEFDKRIINQLVNITKSIENWKVFSESEIAIDYYIYLIFKITDGQLTEILP